MHLIGRQPAQNGHGTVVAAIQISFHLHLQIFKGIEFQEIVEALLIVAVTALHLAIVPWRSGSDCFVLHMDFVTKHIKWMNTSCFLRVIELRSIVCLYGFRCVAEEKDRSPKKVHA